MEKVQEVGPVENVLASQVCPDENKSMLLKIRVSNRTGLAEKEIFLFVDIKKIVANTDSEKYENRFLTVLDLIICMELLLYRFSEMIVLIFKSVPKCNTSFHKNLAEMDFFFFRT